MKRAIRTTVTLSVLLLPAGAMASLSAPSGGEGGAAAFQERDGDGEVWRDIATGEATAPEGRAIYSSEGRRDPFAAYELPDMPGAEDLPSLSDLTLVGILDGEQGPLAVFHGGREETGLFLREGSRLRDGTVREVSLDRESVVVRLPTGDPKKPWVDKELPLHP